MKTLIPPNKYADFLKSTLIDLGFITFDWWSLLHLSSGLFLGYYFDDPLRVFAILFVYEIFEILLRGVLFSGHEDFANIMKDLIVGMAGFYITKYIILKLI